LGTGSQRMTALGAFNLQEARALPFPRPERQSGSSENSAEALRGFGCRTRLRPARAKESGGEAEAPAFRLPLGRGGFTTIKGFAGLLPLSRQTTCRLFSALCLRPNT
jgi:hypothetical protein